MVHAMSCASQFLSFQRNHQLFQHKLDLSSPLTSSGGPFHIITCSFSNSDTSFLKTFASSTWDPVISVFQPNCLSEISHNFCQLVSSANFWNWNYSKNMLAAYLGSCIISTIPCCQLLVYTPEPCIWLLEHRDSAHLGQLILLVFLKLPKEATPLKYLVTVIFPLCITHSCGSHFVGSPTWDSFSWQPSRLLCHMVCSWMTSVHVPSMSPSRSKQLSFLLNFQSPTFFNLQWYLQPVFSPRA